MNFVWILFALLLFEQTLVFGFSISKLQLKAPESVVENATDDSTDVYEVSESKPGNIRLVYPKPEKPTLREITYYHVVEFPYDNTKTKVEPEGPDFDDTRRPFTNSHGFPFGTDVEDKETNNGSLESTEPEIPPENKEVTDDGEETEYGEEYDGDTTDVENTDAETEIPIEETVKTDEDKSGEEARADVEVPDEETYEEEAPAIDERVKEEPTTVKTSSREVLTEDAEVDINEGEETLEDIEVTTAKDDVVEDKLNARSKLFSEVRDKYQSSNSRYAKPTHRSKREIVYQNIPEPPTLPDLDYDIFSPEIRRRVSTTKPPQKPTTKPPNGEENGNFNEEAFKEELMNKIEEMIANIKPNSDDDEDNANRDDDQIDDDRNNKVKRKVRTYGMSLVNDRGVVWNNLWSDPGMSFNVGSLETVDEDDDKKDTEHINEDTNKTSESIDKEPTIHVQHPAESKPIYIDPVEHPDKETNSVESIGHDLEDIFIANLNKPKTDKDKIDDVADIDERFKEEKLREENERKEITINDGGEKSNEEVKAKPDKKESTSNAEKTKHEDEEKLSEEKEHEEKSKRDEKNKDKDLENQEARRGHIDQSEFFNELMNNEQFWKWLSDWTATYMELLMRHIKRMVHDEVSRQMKSYIKALEEKQALKDQPKEENKLSEEKDKKEKQDKATTTDKTDATDIAKDEKETTSNTNLEKQNEEDDLKQKREPNHNKVPLIGSNDKKKEKPVSITANNIYGNTAGSEKVTNIFIFYPGNDDNAGMNLIGDDMNSGNTGDSEIDIVGNKEDSKTESVDEKVDKEGNNDNDKIQENDVNKDNQVDETERPKPDTEINKDLPNKLDKDLNKQDDKTNKAESSTNEQVDTNDKNKDSNIESVVEEKLPNIEEEPTNNQGKTTTEPNANKNKEDKSNPKPNSDKPEQNTNKNKDEKENEEKSLENTDKDSTTEQNKQDVEKEKTIRENKEEKVEVQEETKKPEKETEAVYSKDLDKDSNIAENQDKKENEDKPSENTDKDSATEQNKQDVEVEKTKSENKEEKDDVKEETKEPEKETEAVDSKGTDKDSNTAADESE